MSPIMSNSMIVVSGGSEQLSHLSFFHKNSSIEISLLLAQIKSFTVLMIQVKLTNQVVVKNHNSILVMEILWDLVFYCRLSSYTLYYTFEFRGLSNCCFCFVCLMMSHFNWDYSINPSSLFEKRMAESSAEFDLEIEPIGLSAISHMTSLLRN